METVWKCSSETEAERLIHCAHQIVVRFYRVNNFIVLPYNPGVNNANIVTFPDLPYNKIPRFWEKVKRVDVTNLPLKVDKQLLSEVIGLLSNGDNSLPDFEKTKNLWQKAEKDIIAEIYNIMPKYKNTIRKITIHPTKFGTSSSFNWINKKGEIIVHLREDQGISTIVEAVLTSLTRRDTYKNLGAMWQESELLVDWIIIESSLAKVLKKFNTEVFTPTLKYTRIKQQAKLIDKSNDFYKKLGISTVDNVFSLNGKYPEIYKKPVQNLSQNERILLKLFIENSGSVVSFDKLGENLFSDVDDFSLYAISKSVERLRNKLEANGVSGSYIQTLRGKGYLLKN